MVDFVIIVFGVVGVLVLVAFVSVCHNHFNVFSGMQRWCQQKTHPEMTRTASGYLIRVTQSSVLDEYKLSKTILGKGVSGVCRLGTNIKSKKNYAIKTIELKDDNVTQFYKREIDILKDLEHLNIIRVFEAFEEVGQLGLVMVSDGLREYE
jgi:calcium-dependent protein kinase